ncbi:MAG: TRAP transporter large permease [Bacillota bacterium]
MSGILLISFGALVILNVPLAIGMALSSLLALTITQKVPLFLVVQRMFTGLDSFPLLAIPLFMIAGRLMEHGGISKRLIKLATALVGHVSGGLAMVAILACMFFAAISGSAPATVVAIGAIMVPAMIKAGYDKDFSVALMAAAGTIGVIIPPSIPFVTYGITMNTSIGDLFMAGVVPGIIMGITLMIACYFIAKKRGYKGTEKATFKEVLIAFKDSIWALLMPLIILGGIYGGIFTPTEAATVACVYSLMVGFFIYKELKYQETIKSFSEAGVTAAMVMLIISTATAMGWIMTTEQIPIKVATAIASVASDPIILLLLINIILLITGCIMELNAAIIILGPIFLPLIMQYNIDLVHFGIIMVVNMTIGLLTPPLGVNLFVAGSLLKEVTFKEIVKASFIFLLLLIGDLLLFTYLPDISLFLVRFFS